MRKTDNDMLLDRPTSEVEPKAKQLSFLRFVQKEQPAPPKDPEFEKVLAAVRAEAEEMTAIANAMFPGNDFQRLQDVKDPEQFKQVCAEFHRRHPRPKPERRELSPLREGHYWKVSVRWRNPCAEPPNGKPKLLIEFDIEVNGLTERQQARVDMITARNPGYEMGIGFYDRVQESGVRKWSEERKAKNRLRLLQERVRKRFSIPELYEIELNRLIMLKPEYYGIKPLELPVVVRMPERELLEVQKEAQELNPLEMPFEPERWRDDRSA